MQRQTTEVLVLVKAAPQPSTTYGETVCVAGLHSPADQPTWIRLYPVPFRCLDGERQFHKYQLIEVATRDAGADRRPESRRIVVDSIAIKSTLRTWAQRAQWIERIDTPTMCQLQDAVRRDLNATSLAAVRPTRPERLTFEHNPGWTTEQLRKFEAYRNQGSLIDEVPMPLLHPPRFRVRLRYRCDDTLCPGHQQTILDWELNALQAHHRRSSDEELQTAITERFFQNPFGAKKDPLIFVGNQEDVRRRATFTVLGLYYPDRADAENGRTLF